jgi:hypothetical protein
MITRNGKKLALRYDQNDGAESMRAPHQICYIPRKLEDQIMTAKQTSGFQDLVFFFARPKTIILGLVVALLGGYFLRSNSFALMILIPIAASVGLVLIGVAMGLIPRAISFVIYPSYRAHVLKTFRAVWKGQPK